MHRTLVLLVGQDGDLLLRAQREPLALIHLRSLPPLVPAIAIEGPVALPWKILMDPAQPDAFDQCRVLLADVLTRKLGSRCARRRYPSLFDADGDGDWFEAAKLS